MTRKRLIILGIVAAAGCCLLAVIVGVTPNYELPACKKSVFAWSVEPNSVSLGSIIIGLVQVEGPRAFSVANDIEMDLAAPLQGEALQAVDGGLYYLVVENVSGPWHIWWQCQD